MVNKDTDKESQQVLDEECTLPSERVMAWNELKKSRYGVAPCPSDPLALTNRLVVHPADFPEDVEFALIRNQYILSIM